MSTLIALVNCFVNSIAFVNCYGNHNYFLHSAKSERWLKHLRKCALLGYGDNKKGDFTNGKVEMSIGEVSFSSYLVVAWPASKPVTILILSSCMLLWSEQEVEQSHITFFRTLVSCLLLLLFAIIPYKTCTTIVITWPLMTSTTSLVARAAIQEALFQFFSPRSRDMGLQCFLKCVSKIGCQSANTPMSWRLTTLYGIQNGLWNGIRTSESG